MKNETTATKTIKAAIRETTKEMRAMGVKRTSCFNGGLDRLTYSFNARLFQLKVDLETATKAATLNDR